MIYNMCHVLLNIKEGPFLLKAVMCIGFKNPPLHEEYLRFWKLYTTSAQKGIVVPQLLGLSKAIYGENNAFYVFLIYFNHVLNVLWHLIIEFAQLGAHTHRHIHIHRAQFTMNYFALCNRIKVFIKFNLLRRHIHEFPESHCKKYH